MTDYREERCVVQADAAYPARLRGIRSAPARLYIRGMLPDSGRPAVAVIGARRCSSYGREMAGWFAGELSAAGVQIISGMAAGVDGIAQRAALSGAGGSIGVLGCGTDVCYPAENRDLYEMLLEQGGILSEYPQGTPPVSGHFPARNRIISALADIVLVVEARERSGTLITVDFALDQGRDVYALPGRLTDGQSMGCNRLLRQGAGIALTPGDILEALQGRDRAAAFCSGQKTGRERTSAALSPTERLVLEQMGDRPVTLQELFEKIRAADKETETSVGLPEVTDILMNLTLRELITRESGNKYERKADFRPV